MPAVPGGVGAFGHSANALAIGPNTVRVGFIVKVIQSRSQ
jgi:hypothetical protein